MLLEVAEHTLDVEKSASGNVYIEIYMGELMELDPSYIFLSPEQARKLYTWLDEYLHEKENK